MPQKQKQIDLDQYTPEKQEQKPKERVQVKQRPHHQLQQAPLLNRRQRQLLAAQQAQQAQLRAQQELTEHMMARMHQQVTPPQLCPHFVSAHGLTQAPLI